jgi:hypothetical protein
MWGKTVIRVTRDGLLVDQRPGVVFSFSDTKLGPWILQGLAVGTALHLQSGPHRFVLGGRDHRVAPATPLAAPTVEYDVDASMSASDFDELLTVVARRRGWDVRQPALGEPTRCLLVPNTSTAWPDLGVPGRDLVQRRRRKKLPRLAIAAGKDAIRVIEQDTNALIASASVARVTATPTFYNPESKAQHTMRNIEELATSDWEWHYAKTPVLVVGVPGLPPLTIGCPFTSTYRFEWRGEVPRGTSPDYFVSGADWLTLVETFGLAPQLKESA